MKEEYKLLIPYKNVVSAINGGSKDLLYDICDNISHKELIREIISNGSITKEIKELKQIIIEVIDEGIKNYREYTIYRLHNAGLLELNEEQLEEVTKALLPDWISIKLDEYFNGNRFINTDKNGL